MRRTDFLGRLAPLVFLIILCAALAIARPSFATPANAMTMVQQSAVIIVIAIGQTLLMISGGIDLSVGSVLALSTIVAAILHGMGVPPLPGALAALATACSAGLVNGLVTTKAKVPPFIATLGMMGMARGLALILSRAVSLPIPDVYRWLGSHVSFYAIGVAAVGIGSYILLSKTAFGRNCYATGGNKEAARLSGINVDNHLVKTFTLNGFIIGIASILLMGRLGVVASPTSGEGYELDSIAAAVIGGTSLFGGQGTVGGSLIGSLIMAVLRNGCDQLNIDVNWQIFVIGAMIILAVFYDGLRRRGKAGHK